MAKLFDKISADFMAAIKGVVESTAAYEKARDDEKKARMSGGDKDKVAKLAAMMSKEKKPMKEARGDITVKSVSSADAYKKHTGQDTKKTKVPVDPKTGKTLYQKVTSEEVEELDEISSKTLFSYGKKAKKESEKLNDPMHRHGGRLMASKKTNPARGGYKLTKVAATFGEEVEELDEKLSDEAKAAIRHAAGGGAKVKPLVKLAKMAKEKTANEEVEQVDELSRATMGRYINKAAERMSTQGTIAGMKIKDNESAKRNFKSIDKRQKGIKTAIDKLTKEEIEMIEAKMAGVACGSMEGDKHMCATKVFHKEWNEGTPIKTMHADPDENGLIEWYDVLFDHGIERVMTEDMEILQQESHMHSKRKMKEEAEQIDELSKDTLKSYLDKKSEQKHANGNVVANVNDPASMKKYTNRVVGGVRAAKRLMAKEEVEQIDELSRSTLSAYQAASKEEGRKNRLSPSGASSKVTKRTQGADLAARKSLSAITGKKLANVPATNEEVELDENAKAVAHLIKRYGENVRKSHVRSAANDLGLDASKLAKAVRKKLGKNMLDEARGRPKKAAAKDFTIHPKTGEKLMHNNPEHMKKIEALQRTGALEKPKTEAGQHIINQLRKASTSMQGGATVHFTHGESKHVSAAHAGKALDKYAGMKPNEKEAFQKKISHSHEEMMKHI